MTVCRINYALIELLKVIKIILLFILAVWCGITAGQEIFSAKPNSVLDLSRPMIASTADIQKSGRLDLLVGFQTEDKKYGLAAFYNHEGSFKSKPDRILKDDFDKPLTGITAGDYDGDGKTDIAVTDSSKKLWLFKGVDDFTVPVVHYNTNSSAAPLYAVKFHNSNWSFLSAGVIREYCGGEQFRSGYIYPPQGEQTNKIVIPVDFDGDGQYELLAFTADMQIRIYYGPFKHLMIKEVDCSDIVSIPYNSPISGMAVGDFNRDHRPDFLVWGPQKTTVFLQDSPMGFSQDSRQVALPGGTALAVGDFTGKGHTEIAVADKEQIRIYTDHKEILSIPVRGAYRLATGNINGGVCSDLIVCCYRANKIYLFMNQIKKERQ